MSTFEGLNDKMQQCLSNSGRGLPQSKTLARIF
jgi:hypothetical protein